MERQPMSDDDFIHMYDAYQREQDTEFFRRLAATKTELKEAIDYVIRSKERRRRPAAIAPRRCACWISTRNISRNFVKNST